MNEWMTYQSSFSEFDLKTGILMRKGNLSDFYKAVMIVITGVTVDLSCLLQVNYNLTITFVIDMMTLIQRFPNYNCITDGDLFFMYISLIL